MSIEKPGRPSTSQQANNESKDKRVKDSKIRSMGSMGSRVVKNRSGDVRINTQDKQQAVSFPEESTIKARSVKVAPEGSQDAASPQSGNTLKSPEKLQNNDTTTELPKATTEASAVTESHAVHHSSIPSDALKTEPPSTSPNSDAEFLAELTQLFDEKGQNGLTVDKEGMHPLHYAAQHGLIHSVQYLLEKGDAQQLINLKDNDQNNLIHMAASAGHIDLLNWLSDQYGTEVLLTKGHNGFTALHFAAREGHLSCVERLLDIVPDSFNLIENGGSCAIHWAAWAGKLDVLKVMVKRYGEQILSQTGNGGNNALHFAAQMGHLDCVGYILTMCEGLQSEVNELGQNSFHKAAKDGHAKVLRYLIAQHDAEGLKAADKDGNTPAHLAACYGWLEVLKQLSEKGGPAILMEKGSNGFTPLYFSINRGHLECVEFIIKNYPESQSVVDDSGDNVFHLAAVSGQSDILHYLIAQSSSEGLSEGLKAADTGGNTPLHLAAAGGYDRCVAELLTSGDDLHNLTNNQGITAAHFAAYHGRLGVLKQLSEKGGPAILMEKGSKGFTPLCFSIDRGHLECVEFIIKNCPESQSVVDDSGNNVFHLAADAGQADILRYLIAQSNSEDLSEGLKAAGTDGNTPLHLAAADGYDQCVAELLTSGDDLHNLTNNQGITAAHLAAYNGRLEVLKQLFEKGGPAILMEKDSKGITPFYFSINRGHLECVEFIIKSCPESQSVVNDSGNNVFHYAAVSGHADILRYLIDHTDSEALKVTNKDGTTPLHIAEFIKHHDCVKGLLSHQTIQESISRIDLFGDLVSGDPIIAKLLAEARKEHGTKYIPWLVPDSEPSTVDSKPSTADSEPSTANSKLSMPHNKRKQPNKGALFDSDGTVLKKSRIGQSAEWPLMAKKKGDSSFALQAETVLSGLKRVGLYLINPVYSGETEKQFWSMGDLNAGVQMANILERMGAKSLDVVLSPPDNSTWSQRQVHTESERREYDAKQAIAQHKLACLWPGFNPVKSLPQTLTIGSCQVTIRDCDNRSSVLPSAMFSFTDAKTQYQQSKELPETIITLKPYRFASQYRLLTTDIQGSRGNVFPLRLPDNSVIPEIKDDSHGIERSSIVISEAADSTSLGKVINQLKEKSRSRQLDLGVVYGLHHKQLLDSWPTVLDKWLSTVKAYAKQSTDQKPAIIAVASNVNLETDLKQFAEKQKLPLIDLSTISCVVDDQQEAVAEQLIQQISQLQPGKPALCILPSLSKPQFDELVLSSRLPTLAEGANLTSFLLQHGHPYLSVLPSGDTPVAQDMGDPFEALKAQAFSYKLAINEAEQEVLELLTSLIKGKEKESYKKAIDKINGLDPQKVPNLRFLWELPKPSTFLELEQLTVMKLLKKGQEGKLGDTGQNALLSALDPSPEAFEQYTRNAMNEESVTAKHFELQQMHVNGPSLNTVASALVQLGEYKGVLK